MKRNALRILALVTVLTLFSSISPAIPVSAQEGRVVIYTPTSADVTDPLIAEFTADTGIAVEVVYGGTGVMWSRVRAEKGRPFGDILWAGSDKMYEAAKPEGLFISYHSPQVEYYPITDPEGLWYAIGIPGGVQSFGVNTTLMPDPEDYPTSYRDFADIKYDGMIALLNPTYSGTGYITAQLFIHLAETQWGYVDGWDFLRKVMMNSKVFVSSGAARAAVRDGEVAMGVLGEKKYAEMVKDGFPVYLLPMEEGYFGGLDGIAIIKGGPNPEEAKVFIDWFLSLKGQQMLADIKGDRPTREGITMHEDLYTYGFGDVYTHVDIPMALFEDPDGFKKEWNAVMGEAILLKGARDTAYAKIEAAESSIAIAEAEGRTIGLEEAEAKLADAEAAFAEDMYEDAEAFAMEALELSGGVAAPFPIWAIAIMVILSIAVIVPVVLLIRRR